MPSSLFSRGSAIDESDDNLPMPSLRHARSTSAFQTITPLRQRPPTISSSAEASRAALLLPLSPSSTAHVASSPTEWSSLPSPVSNLVSPNFSACPSSPAPDNDGSFAQNIRFRLSSMTRKPLPFLQISYSFRNDDPKKMQLQAKPACVGRQKRSISTSTTGNVAKLDATSSSSPYDFPRSPTKPNLDMKPQKQTSGKTLFHGGLAKAHKKLFGSKSKDDDESQDDNSAGEEDVNLIYSNVMIPLDFPTEEDEGNGFIVVSPVDTPDFRNYPFALTPRKKFSSLPVQPTTPLPLSSRRRVPLPSSPPPPGVL